MNNDIDSKLEAARNNAVGYGKKRGAKEIADDRLRGTYAMIFEGAPKGTVAEMDAWVRRQEEYKEAIEDKSNSYAEWEAAQLYVKILFCEVDKYRTDAASDRAIDRMHR